LQLKQTRGAYYANETRKKMVEIISKVLFTINSYTDFFQSNKIRRRKIRKDHTVGTGS
jgi:hypothetical protein